MTQGWLELHVEDLDGNYLALLDGAFRKGFQATLSEPGAGKFAIHAADAKATAANLAVGNVVRVRYQNTEIGAWSMENFGEILVDEGEEPARVITVAGRGLLATLGEGLVYPENIYDATTAERKFTKITKAQIFVSLYEELQARGGGELTLGFDGALDSNGNPWTDEVTLTYRAGQKLLEVLRNLGAFGMEFALAGKTLNAYPLIGSDLSAAIIFREGQAILRARTDTEGTLLANAILAEGAGAFYETIDGTSIGAHHRREYHLPVQNTNDLRQLLLANTIFLRLRKEPAPRYEIEVFPEPWEPFVHYGVGDYVGVEHPRVPAGTDFRVVEITLQEEGEGNLRVTLGINDRATDYLERLQRAVEASLLMARPVNSSITTSTGGDALTKLWIGFAEGPRVGAQQYETPDGEASFVHEAVGPDNVPFFSLSAIDREDPDAVEGSFGYETFPRIHMETVPGYARKLPLVDVELIDGGATGMFTDRDGNVVTVVNGVIMDLGVGT